MMTFKEFMIEQDHLEERLVRKGAVSGFAIQGKKHGDDAVKSWTSAKRELRRMKTTSDADPQLLSALIDLLDGLISSRKQLGSVSAQITAAQLLSRGGRT